MKAKLMFSSNSRVRSRAPSLAVPLIALLVSMAACGADDRPRSSASGGTGNAAVHTGGRDVGTPQGGQPVTDGGAGAGGAPDSTGGVSSSGAPGSQGGAESGGGAGATSVDSGGGGQAVNSGGTAGSGGLMTGGAGSAGEVSTGAAGAAGAGGVAGEPEPPQLNGCSNYVDRAAPEASRTLPWDASIAIAPERCMKIRVGQQVVFDGDFDVHPLEPFGGDAPSPFSSTSWHFDQPGAFGFICTIHSEMVGVIWVVR